VLTGPARCWFCSLYETPGSLRSIGFGSIGFDCNRLPGVGADCRRSGGRHTQRHRYTRHPNAWVGSVPDNLCQSDGCHSRNTERYDGGLGGWIRRCRRIDRWGLGQPIEHARQPRLDIVLSGYFRWVFGERDDCPLERRSGVGAVPTPRSLGNAALCSRDRPLLRALTASLSARWCAIRPRSSPPTRSATRFALLCRPAMGPARL